MKKEEKIITYICDGCGERFRNDNDNVGYIDLDIWDEAEDCGWHEIDGNHYCPDCCQYDEEKDEYVPKGGQNGI